MQQLLFGLHCPTLNRYVVSCCVQRAMNRHEVHLSPDIVTMDVFHPGNFYGSFKYSLLHRMESVFSAYR